MKKSKTSLEKERGGKKQYGKKQLQEMLRPHIPNGIKKLVEMFDDPNPSVRLGAIKLAMSKVIPDLKATDLTSDGDKIQGIDVVSLLKKAYGDTPRPVNEVHPDGEKV
jgi:hypothetical protein